MKARRTRRSAGQAGQGDHLRRAQPGGVALVREIARAVSRDLTKAGT